MTEVTRKGPKRLTIDINEEMHKQIKMLAIKRNITLRTWLVRLIVNGIQEEKKYE